MGWLAWRAIRFSRRISAMGIIKFTSCVWLGSCGKGRFGDGIKIRRILGRTRSSSVRVIFGPLNLAGLSASSSDEIFLS